MENTQFTRPSYFNLKKDGDTAVVRLLHTSTATIESQLIHTVKVEDKLKKIKCTLKDCPLCAAGSLQQNKVYIHIWNYDTKEEEVWERTDKILPSLMVVERDWKPLYSAVVRITRKGNDFPSYEVTPLNPMQYDSADNYKGLVDKPYAKMMSMTRKNEDIAQFLATGQFPEKKKFVSKEEYFKDKQGNQQESFQSAPQPPVIPTVVQTPPVTPTVVTTYSYGYQQPQPQQPQPTYPSYNTPMQQPQQNYSQQPQQPKTEMEDYFDPFSAPTKVTRV